MYFFSDNYDIPPLSLQIGYDKRFYEMISNHGFIDQFLNDVVLKTSDLFTKPDSNLPRIIWKIESIEYFEEVQLTADELCNYNENMEVLKDLRRGNPVPLILFSGNVNNSRNSRNLAGCSYPNSACGNKLGSNFGVIDVDYSSLSSKRMARQMAQELGKMVCVYCNCNKLTVKGKLL